MHKVRSEHSRIVNGNFNLNEKTNYIFRCDCNVKNYKITKESIRNITVHIKNCSACVVNIDFTEFIFLRAGTSEEDIATNQRASAKIKQITESTRVLRSNH